jgi:hypothetical protein
MYKFFLSGIAALVHCCGHTQAQMHLSVRLLGSSASMVRSILVPEMLYINFFATFTLRAYFSLSNLQNTKTPKLTQTSEQMQIKGPKYVIFGTHHIA